MATVKVTDLAHQEAQKMLSIITNQMPTLINSLYSTGHHMSDPNNWDGPLAQRFRGEVWPQAKADLDEALDLEVVGGEEQVPVVLLALPRHVVRPLLQVQPDALPHPLGIGGHLAARCLAQTDAVNRLPGTPVRLLRRVTVQ